MNVKKNQEIIVVLIVLAVLMTLSFQQRQKDILDSLEAQQIELIKQQAVLLERSAELDVKIEKLQKGQEAIVVPEINPKFLEWWHNEEKKISD